MRDCKVLGVQLTSKLTLLSVFRLAPNPDMVCGTRRLTTAGGLAKKVEA
jgi:hypothetical protein